MRVITVVLCIMDLNARKRHIYAQTIVINAESGLKTVFK